MKKQAGFSKQTHSLDYYFKNAAVKAEKTCDDVIFVKEVKVSSDHHSAVAHRSSLKNKIDNCKPRRLRDTIRNNKLRKLRASELPRACHKELLTAGDATPEKCSKDFGNNNCAERRIKTESAMSDDVGTKDHAITSFGTSRSAGIETLPDDSNKETSRTCLSLSLRVLDSQKYDESDNESKDADECDGMDEVLSMDISLLKRTASCDLNTAASSSEELSDDDVFAPKYKAASLSKTPITSRDAPPIALSTPYSSSELVISSKHLPKSKTHPRKGAKSARKLKLSHQRSPSPDSSPGVLNSKKDYHIPVFKKECDSGAKHREKGPNLTSSVLGDSLESTIQAAGDSSHCQPSTAASPTRSFTPDDGLEEVMLSMNEANSFSPTKQSKSTITGELAHLPPPITSGDGMAVVRASLNSSYELSVSKNSSNKIPYYLASILTAIEEIMSCPFDVQYIDVVDLKTIQVFQSSPAEAQMLYARMLFRKFGWIPESKLKYKEIENKESALLELMSRDLIMCNTEDLSLEELLNMLPVPSLKKVCQQMKIDFKQKRTQLINSMLEHTRQRTVSSIFKNTLTAEQVMIRWVKKELRPCYKLVNEYRSVFLRLLMLYALVFDMPNASRMSGSSTHSQLVYMMLEQAVGQTKFPQVVTNRMSKIFMKREHVLRRQRAQELEEMLDGFLQKKDFSSALPSIIECQECFNSWISDTELFEFDKHLPIYLRRYTCTGQILSCMSISADILQKLKKWDKAANIYDLMLSQKVYRLNSRGYWYERLSLICHSHMKNYERAAKAIVEALADSYVRGGHRLSIYLRGKKLQSSDRFKNKIGCPLDGIRHDELVDIPQTEISADGITGQIPDTDRVNVFLNTDTRGQVTGGSKVEDVAKKHYMAEENLDRGEHRESSVYTTMFGLLFWDIIFQPGISDTFFNNYQCKPLDFQSDEFYPRRRKSIEERLREVRQASRKELAAIVEPVWRDKYEQCSICVSWDVFQSADDVLDLMLCLGMPLLADICERLAKGYRFCRSGLPDLTMWNGQSGKYKIVEVKGPGDTLSTKQRLWLDYLVRRGANAEVCHVKIAGNKGRKKL
ncbi:fanconi-associated nuclease 1-like [Watersipora subatra]|uniref:fanconi-associated nuclease 1-like n=1 Tax=Watersipora subatra TaxID=2589382 RepID=UPI00355BD1B2